MIPKGNKCYLSYFTSARHTTELATTFLDEILKKEGLNARYEIFENDESGVLCLSFDAFDPDEEEEQHQLADDLEALGFDSDDYYENFNVVLSKMLSTQADHSFDEDGMVVELHGESEIIMDKLNTLFNSIDHLTADEAKIEIGLIYKTLKEKYGW